MLSLLKSGPAIRTASIILKHLLPNILITFVNSKGATSISKAAKQVRGNLDAQSR